MTHVGVLPALDSALSPSSRDNPVRAAFWDGVKAITPMLLGVFPFGVVAGAVAIDLGLTVYQALGLSVFYYAGASQLAAMQMMAAGAPFLMVIVTVTMVNLRMLMYSAAVAPYLRDLSAGGRLTAAYLLTDQSFTYTVSKYRHQGGSKASAWFYMGAAIPMWLTWQLGTMLGAAFGAQVPDTGIVSFVIPIIFLTLLMPALTDRASLAAAVVSGVTVILVYHLPPGLEIVIASLAGIVAGVLVEGVRS